MPKSIMLQLPLISFCISFILVLLRFQSTQASDTSDSGNIIVQNHQDIEEWWVAFYLSNADLSCGGSIVNAEISDNNHYKNIWIKNDAAGLQWDQYTFPHDGFPFSVPLSVRITKNDKGINETILGCNVITNFTSSMEFDFGTNFCQQTLLQNSTDCNFIYTDPASDLDLNNTISVVSIAPDTSIEMSYAYFQYGIIIVFLLVAFIGLIDAKCVRRNDFFQVGAILTAMFQISDMLSDAFFAIDVFDKYKMGTEDSFKFFIIFVASVSCILIPVIISLYQLHSASSKYWLNENTTRQWLVTYGKLLYLISILSGSSFTAICIFNSNLFGLDIFDIGLNRKRLLSWNTKKIYSVILFENCPQLLLSIWYILILGQATFIPVAQIIFSLISIIITVLAMCLQKKIYFTQDFVYITIDIKGQCIIDKAQICKRRIYGIKQYISESVLGVNNNSVDIEKPIHIPNGIQIRLHISYIHQNANINPTDNYYDLLQDAQEQGDLQKMIKNEWNLSSIPVIHDIQCSFHRSKEKKMISILAKKKLFRTDDGDVEGSEGMPLEDTEAMKKTSIELMENIQLNVNTHRDSI